MPRALLIGNHEEFRQGLESSGALAGDDRDKLIMAFREMLMNAMEHGAGFDPEKVVSVTAIRTDRAIVATPAPGFPQPGSKVPPCPTPRPTRSPTSSAGPRWACGRAGSGCW